MTIKFSNAVLDARNDATRDTIGAAPTLKMFDLDGNPEPANCAASDVGIELLAITLPTNWLTDSSGGANAIIGTWTATGAATGDAEFFRIYQGSTCHMQGTITATGDGGDIELDSVGVSTSRLITITSFGFTG